MIAFLVKFVHLIVCIGLIVIVLFQADKGEGLAGAFGGGASSSVFGERGSGGFMSKLTTGLAVVFMITSLIIAGYGKKWDDEAAQEARRAPITATPAQQAPITATPAPVAPAQQAAPVTPAPVAPVQQATPVAPAPQAIPANAVVAPVTPVQPVVEEKKAEAVEAVKSAVEEKKAEAIEAVKTVVEEKKAEAVDALKEKAAEALNK